MKSAASNWLASLTSFQHSALASYNLTSVHPVGFRLVANLIAEIYALIPDHVKRESRNISVRILSFLTSTMSHKMPTTSETELIKVMHHHQHHPHSEIPVIFLTSHKARTQIHSSSAPLRLSDIVCVQLLTTAWTRWWVHVQNRLRFPLGTEVPDDLVAGGLQQMNPRQEWQVCSNGIGQDCQWDTEHASLTPQTPTSVHRSLLGWREQKKKKKSLMFFF